MYKKLFLVLALVAVIFSFAACSSYSSKSSSRGSSSQSNQMAISPDREIFEERGLMEDGDSAPAAVGVQDDRKVIFNGGFDLQTKDYDATMTKLDEIIAATKSYIESSNSYGDKEQGNAEKNLTLRVPSDKYEEFKAEIANLGNIISSSESGNDVTGEYFDTEARLTVLRAQEKRILELLEKAANIEDIIKIETELSRIRSEIEQLTTVIKRYDDLVSYSTLELNIQQTNDYLVKNKTFFDKLGDAMQSSLTFGLKMLETLAYVVVWVLPYLIILALIAAIVLVIVKKSQKNRQKNKNNNPPPVNIQK